MTELKRNGTGDLPLYEEFNKTFPKRGTHGSKLNQFKGSPEPAISEFAIAVDELARQKAQLLIELAKPEVGIARSYEKGYPTRGPASKLVRGNLHRSQHRELDPSEATIIQLN